MSAARVYLRGPAEDRFWASALMVESCWEWLGHLSTTGYGHMFVNGRAVKAHRYAYELRRGPIPAGLTIDHLCRNRACVNPDHLEPVTMAENILRGTAPSARQARQTHCKRGHELTGLYEGPNQRHRYCLVCHEMHRATYNANRRGQS